MDSERAKERYNGQMERGMRDSGKRALLMDRVCFIILTEIYMMASGRIISVMAMECTQIRKGQSTWEIGKMIHKKAKAQKLGQKARSI